MIMKDLDLFGHLANVFVENVHKSCLFFYMALGFVSENNAFSVLLLHVFLISQQPIMLKLIQKLKNVKLGNFTITVAVENVKYDLQQ